MKDLPENTTFKADMLVSISPLTRKFYPSLDQQWGNFGNSPLRVVKAHTNAACFQTCFLPFFER